MCLSQFKAVSIDLLLLIIKRRIVGTKCSISQLKVRKSNQELVENEGQD